MLQEVDAKRKMSVYLTRLQVRSGCDREHCKCFGALNLKTKLSNAHAIGTTATHLFLGWGNLIALKKETILKLV